MFNFMLLPKTVHVSQTEQWMHIPIARKLSESTYMNAHSNCTQAKKLATKLETDAAQATVCRLSFSLSVSI